MRLSLQWLSVLVRTLIMKYSLTETKTNLFSESQNELASVAKAFSHPARVAILQDLLKTNACINGDLVQEIVDKAKV